SGLVAKDAEDVDHLLRRDEVTLHFATQWTFDLTEMQQRLRREPEHERREADRFRPALRWCRGRRRGRRGGRVRRRARLTTIGEATMIGDAKTRFVLRLVHGGGSPVRDSMTRAHAVASDTRRSRTSRPGRRGRHGEPAPEIGARHGHVSDSWTMKAFGYSRRRRHGSKWHCTKRRQGRELFAAPELVKAAALSERLPRARRRQRASRDPDGRGTAGLQGGDRIATRGPSPRACRAEDGDAARTDRAGEMTDAAVVSRIGIDLRQESGHVAQRPLDDASTAADRWHVVVGRPHDLDDVATAVTPAPRELCKALDRPPLGRRARPSVNGEDGALARPEKLRDPKRRRGCGPSEGRRGLV